MKSFKDIISGAIVALVSSIFFSPIITIFYRAPFPYDIDVKGFSPLPHLYKASNIYEGLWGFIIIAVLGGVVGLIVRYLVRNKSRHSLYVHVSVVITTLFVMLLLTWLGSFNSGPAILMKLL